MNKALILALTLSSLWVSACQSSVEDPMVLPSTALTPTSKGENLTPGSKGENLTPGSKGENLTPTSKGEHRFQEIRGEFVWPEALGTLDLAGDASGRQAGLVFFASGAPIPPERIQIKSLSQERYQYIISELSSEDRNFVLDLQRGALRLSLMIPQIDDTALNNQNIDFHSTALVAVARKAEADGLRAIEDWSSAELQELERLPQLDTLGQAFQQAYPDRVTHSEQEALDDLTASVLDAFLGQLEELNSQQT